jgi:hypothetical protein
MAQNKDKNRKSKAEEIFDEANNAGRFAGNDTDARAARDLAVENIRQDTNSNRRERNQGDENTDAEARRDPAQTHDYKGEAQNVNDDTGRPLNEDETEHARNKATEGTRQNRGTSDSGTNTKTYK